MPPIYRVSDGFFKLLFVEERGVEPLLLVDQNPDQNPQRIFLVRYVVGEGGGGESKRPVFKDELTGYDYETKLLYPTQRVQLDALQSSLEPSMYSSSEAKMLKAQVENVATTEQRLVKVIASDALIARLVGLYQFGW